MQTKCACERIRGERGRVSIYVHKDERRCGAHLCPELEMGEEEEISHFHQRPRDALCCAAESHPGRDMGRVHVCMFMRRGSVRGGIRLHGPYRKILGERLKANPEPLRFPLMYTMHKLATRAAWLRVV
ncbi:hypothetical protein MRX96_030736 [Rhipicephalus microplus]